MIELIELVPGEAAGPIAILTEPLSFWGGFESASGEIIDRRHPQVGLRLSGTIVVMPGGRGSSSATYVIAEAIRLGTAPSGFILGRSDPIISLGAVVAEEMYGITCPIALGPPKLAGLVSDWKLAHLSGPTLSRIG